MKVTYDLLDEFLVDRYATGASEVTIEDYRNHLRRFFITSVLYSFTELFSGLTKGLAGVSVSAADSLILNSDGSLTSFSQIGIVFIGIELVLAVIFFLVRRIR